MEVRRSKQKLKEGLWRGRAEEGEVRGMKDSQLAQGRGRERRSGAEIVLGGQR